MAVLTAVFALGCLAYLFVDRQLLQGLRKLVKSADRLDAFPQVTVLIAARDEEFSLPRTLDALLAQTYPPDKTQILIINDRSEDGTAKVLQRYAEANPDRIEFLTVSEVPPNLSPKKHALLRGLEKARGEWIVTTDADCRMGPKWLTALSGDFREGTGMILGMTCYEEPDAGFNAGQGSRALEFASYGIVSAALGFPVHANANNLAYRRKAFDQASAFRKHGHIVSGDDDFTLQEIHATGTWGIGFCASPDALVRTAPPETWEHFWEQRKRWASKCGLYRPKQAIFLAAIFLFYSSIPAFLIAGIWNPFFFWLGSGIFLLKTGADYAVMRRGLSVLGLSPLMRFFPLTALLHIPLILGAVLWGTFAGFTWKGQRFAKKIES